MIPLDALSYPIVQGHIKVAFDPWLEWRMMGAAVGCGWVDGLTG